MANVPLAPVGGCGRTARQYRGIVAFRGKVSMGEAAYLASDITDHYFPGIVETDSRLRRPSSTTSR
jgi:hypothetical protein